MRRIALNKSAIATFLSLALILGMFASVGFAGQRRSYRNEYYRRHRHSKTKGAIVGGIAGGLGGALIGGKKGALIGAGAGAGTGYLIQRHRNRKLRRRVYRR